MRVIGGFLRGQVLNSFTSNYNSGLRPTSDRVKESMFNILSHKFHVKFEDVKVLDLFAGTGSLGFEAISRGTENVTFVENNNYACELILKNSQSLKVESNVSIIKEDCLNLGLNDSDPYGLVFLDPPYGSGLGERVVDLVLDRKWLKNKSIIVWEENNKISNLKYLKILDIRKYGETVLSFAEVLI